jgi:DNA-binding GntR family transcriptional regulator
MNYDRPIADFTVEPGQGLGRSARSSIYEQLRHAIVTLEFEPGRRLSENHLAGLFQVSRTPVRESLARLRADRLVEIAPQSGTFVALISRRAVGDAQFIRQALECAAVRLSAARIDEPGLARLQALVDQHEQANERGEDALVLQVGDAFHQALFQASGLDLWDVVARADGHLHRLHRLAPRRRDDVRALIAEHRLVLDALARRDPDGAEAVLREHIEVMPPALDELQLAHPEYFATE